LNFKNFSLKKYLKKRYLLALILVILVGFLFYFRALAFADCKLKAYDLKRPTDFRLVTGRCTTEGKDGKAVYVDQLRGIGGDDIGDAVQ